MFYVKKKHREIAKSCPENSHQFLRCQVVFTKKYVTLTTVTTAIVTNVTHTTVTITIVTFITDTTVIITTVTSVTITTVTITIVTSTTVT